jgi:hypothetical protein
MIIALIMTCNASTSSPSTDNEWKINGMDHALIDESLATTTTAVVNDGNLTIKSLKAGEIVSAVVDLKVLCLYEVTNRTRDKVRDAPYMWYYNVRCHSTDHISSRPAWMQTDLPDSPTSYENIAQIPHSILSSCKGSTALLSLTLVTVGGGNATDQVCDVKHHHKYHTSSDRASLQLTINRWKFK